MKTKKLHKIAPKLSSIKKDTGFNVPENYFDSFEDGVFAEISKNKVAKIKNTNNFKTPDNYFDSIEDLVITKLKSELLQNKNNLTPENYFETIEDRVLSKLEKKQKVISLRKNTLKYAASFAIAASLALVFILNPSKNGSEITFDSLETSEIEQLIQNGIIEVNTVTLSSAFPDFDVENSLDNNSISNEDLLNYLGSENLENLLLEN
ncbi:hypothetical protein [Lutibacter sp.]|uniref:hypothetical protein n=1 Tax=Lutibacter sp. TaxID=1925666 RepID=UPI001A2F9227|nr:hypothetical protein [Lutibacter sp.]MBI9041472.1 hypothetical protein [Lutibacter sp.]